MEVDLEAVVGAGAGPFHRVSPVSHTRARTHRQQVAATEVISRQRLFGYDASLQATRGTGDECGAES